jgi:hypothetical protein
MILKWWDVKFGVETPPGYVLEEKYFIDSITAVNFTDSMVTLSVERYGRGYLWENGSNYDSTADHSYPISETKTITHKKSSFSWALRTTPGWFNISPPNNGALHYSSNDFSNWDLPTSKYDDWSIQFDTTSTICDILIADPQYLDKTITKGLGITHHGLIGGFFFFIHLETKLLGYGYNGEYFGDVLNPVFSKPIPTIDFTIYPNPTRNFLYVDLPEKNNLKKFDLKIFAPSGKVLLEKNNIQSIERINTSDLPPGIYFITINGNKHFGRERFIKL